MQVRPILITVALALAWAAVASTHLYAQGPAGSGTAPAVQHRV